MTVINNIFRFIFPERDTARLVRTASDIVHSYRPRVHDGCVSLASYHDPVIAAAIRELKFHNNERAAVLLATLLNKWIEEHVHAETLIVPMPLSPARRRERGYNQVTRIATHAANHRVAIAEDILRRQRYTKPQTSLTRDDRIKNMHDAFSASRHVDIPIILLDDVYTTGATMRAARDVLVQRGAQVTCVALAH